MTQEAVDRKVALVIAQRFKGKADQVARSAVAAMEEVNGKPQRVKEELVATLFLSFVGVLFKEGHIVIKEVSGESGQG